MMSLIYNDVAKAILSNIDKFVPSKYNIEYRKNKSFDDLSRLVESITLKSTDFENNITILAVSLRSIFKQMRKRKYTMISMINGNVCCDFIEKTDDELIDLKNSVKNDTIFLSGHCTVEGIT